MEPQEGGPAKNLPVRSVPPGWFVWVALALLVIGFGGAVTASVVIHTRSAQAASSVTPTTEAEVRSPVTPAVVPARLGNGNCQWIGTKPNEACGKCECAGLKNEDGKCAWDPMSNWKVSPWQIQWQSTAALALGPLSLCVKPTGYPDWTCNRPVAPRQKDDKSYFAFDDDSTCLIVSYSQFAVSGLDVEIRTPDGKPVWKAVGLHYKNGISPGRMLFGNGLLLGPRQAVSVESSRGVQDIRGVVIALQPAN